MLIYVRDEHTGLLHALEVDSRETIEQLLQRLKALVRFPTGRVRLLYRDLVLTHQSGMMIGEWPLRAGCVLNFQWSERGGRRGRIRRGRGAPRVPRF